MSSSILTSIQTQLSQYGYPIFLILGNIGNVFIVILFSRQRQNTCPIYLMGLAVMNDIYLSFNSLVQIFPFYYRDETIRAFILCKLRFYLPTVLGQISKTILVLVCIDRFLITNDRAHFRAFSTPRRAKWLIFFFIIFWSLLSSHAAIMGTIVNGQCAFVGIYSTIYSVYSIVFVGLFPPITLSIFGYLTYRNMRQRLSRVQPIAQNTTDANHTVRRRDRELLIMVISEVFVYVVTAIPYSLILLEMLISKYIVPSKSVQYLQIESFITTVTLLLLFANSAASFYIYLISSKPFRREVNQLFIKGYQKLTRQTPVLAVPRTQYTLTQHDTAVQTNVGMH